MVKEPFTAVLRKNPPLMLIYTLKNTTEQWQAVSNLTKTLVSFARSEMETHIKYKTLYEQFAFAYIIWPAAMLEW